MSTRVSCGHISTQAAFLQIDDGRAGSAVTALSDLEQTRITVPMFLGIFCFIRACHPSLPKIPFVLHFEASILHSCAAQYKDREHRLRMP
jgi:hypothetical protein